MSFYISFLSSFFRKCSLVIIRVYLICCAKTRLKVSLLFCSLTENWVIRMWTDTSIPQLSLIQTMFKKVSYMIRDVYSLIYFQRNAPICVLQNKGKTKGGNKLIYWLGALFTSCCNLCLSYIEWANSWMGIVSNKRMVTLGACFTPVA